MNNFNLIVACDPHNGIKTELVYVFEKHEALCCYLDIGFHIIILV